MKLRIERKWKELKYLRNQQWDGHHSNDQQGDGSRTLHEEKAAERPPVSELESPKLNMAGKLHFFEAASEFVMEQK